MRRLSVYIEIKGTQVYVGEICGNTPEGFTSESFTTVQSGFERSTAGPAYDVVSTAIYGSSTKEMA